MRVRYLGHSCLWLEFDGSKVLIDPFIRPNPRAAHIDVDALKPDFVLLTHGHEGHVADAREILGSSGAELICGFEVGNWFGARGIDKIQPLNPGGGIERAFGRVEMTPAIHSSSMPDGSYGGAPGGFVVTTEEGSFYHSGDTALSVDMQVIGERHDLAWAALCLGDVFTMGIDGAIECAHMVGVSRVLGIHYDTFPPIEIDHDEAIARFQDAGLDLLLPNIGDTLEL